MGRHGIGIALVGLLVAGCASSARGGSAPRVLPDRAGSHRAHAVVAAERVLDAVRVPPGLHRVGDGAPYGLGEPFSQPASTADLVDQHRVWAGRGDAGTVLAFLRRHLPPGGAESGSGSTTDGSAPGRPHLPSISGLTVSLDGRWQRPEVYSGLGLQFSVTERGSLAAVRADAQTVYLPTRTADQHVPSDVTGADLVAVTRTSGSTSARTVRRTATSGVARRLAADLDALRPAVPAVHGCPMITHTTVTTLRFGGGPTAVYTDSACGGAVDLGRGPALQPDARFARDVRAALR